MLPGNPAVSLVQNYLRAQQGVIEVARSAPEQLLLTDHNGVVIITSRPEWRFRATRPLNDEELASFNYSANNYVNLMKKYRDS